MLTRNITATRDIPGEPGQTMTLRQLSWRHLAEAQEAKAVGGLRQFRGLADVLTAIQSSNRTDTQQSADLQAKAAEQQAADPTAQYDIAIVLHYGIVGWSYPDKLNADSIDSLDAATAKWAATEIITMGKPAPEEELEERFFGSPDSSMATPATATVALQAALGHPTNGSSA